MTEKIENEVKEEIEYVLPNGDNGTDKSIFSLWNSINDHLTPEYRKKYLVRKILCCFFIFLIWIIIFASMTKSSIIPLLLASVMTILSFKFWHYSYWSYQGGLIDTFLRNYIRFGTFWNLVGRTILQHVLVYLWITFIAPFSGIKTWRKAVKNDKILYVEKLS